MPDPIIVNRQSILQVIFATIDEINEMLPVERQLKKSNDTRLFGKQGELVSLEFVNFIVMLEQRVADEFGIAVTLADERAISQERSPFSTVERLEEYLGELLKGSSND